MEKIDRYYDTKKSSPIIDVSDLIKDCETMVCLFKTIESNTDIEFVSISEKLANVFGYSQNEILNVKPRELAKNYVAYKKYVENAIEKEYSTFAYDINRRGDDLLTLDFKTVKVRIAAEEYILCFVIEDNSNKKIFEDYFMGNQEMYRKMVEIMSDGVFLESDNKIVYSNISGANLLGESRYNIIGKEIYDYLLPESKNEWTELREGQELYKTSLTAIDHRCKRKSGKLIDLDISSVPIEYRDKECVISVVRDVTSKKICERNLKRSYDDKMKLIDRMLELEKQKSAFFSNISHDFKTPLNVILGSIQLLESYIAKSSSFDMKSPELVHQHFRTKKNLDVMKQNCYRLLRLLNNIIDSNKVDAEFMEMYLSNMDIVKVVEDITMSIVEYAENKKIKIIFDTTIEEKSMVFDPEKIERILLNLLSNALKYTPPLGEIRVCIEEVDNNIEISVIDTGVGIPKDKLRKIFGKFEQVKDHNAKQGSGLGLYLVKSLAELHKGHVFAESIIDVGTKFVVSIPTDLHVDISSNRREHRDQGIIEKLVIEFSDIYSS